MEQCSRECAKSIIDLYDRNLDEAIQKIRKNFNDMDIMNSSIRDDFNYIIDNMIAECESLRRCIDDVHLR